MEEKESLTTEELIKLFHSTHSRLGVLGIDYTLSTGEDYIISIPTYMHRLDIIFTKDDIAGVTYDGDIPYGEVLTFLPDVNEIIEDIISILQEEVIDVSKQLFLKNMNNNH